MPQGGMAPAWMQVVEQRRELLPKCRCGHVQDTHDIPVSRDTNIGTFSNNGQIITRQI